MNSYAWHCMCFHVDDSGSGIHASYYIIGTECEHVSDVYHGHTLQFHSMLESDTPLLDKLQGRLKQHASLWEDEIKASEFVLGIIKLAIYFLSTAFT